MPVISRTLRTAARRLRRWYLFACAREDAHRHGCRVPTGVWACAQCHFFSFDALGFGQHVAMAHAG